MCGICGILEFGKEHIISEGLLKKMCATLRHRGPDDEGIYINKNGQSPFIGLGHRRLAVIDLKTGHQPMSNEDESIWIVENGEIYNFQELRSDLEKKGHRFKTNSDTEVILHLYEDDEEECVKYLRGAFAFAIWDERKKKLLLARDRIGQKPLCYILQNNRLVFASEIKAILEVPGVEREVNLEAMHHYLTYQYVPFPLTMFKKINKLPPAHILVWEKGEIKLERYWTLDYRHKLKMREEEHEERILELLKEAIKLRLISDVPLGVMLSGGIDSSAVVGMMSKLMDRPIKTFSIGFEERAYNELGYACTVARHFGTQHHEFVVKPQALEVLPKLIWHYDEPFADSSAIPSYYVAKMTREHVTVALNGDGGDESFAGYERYIADKLSYQAEIIPAFLRKGIASLAKSLPAFKAKSMGAKLKRFARVLSLSPETRHFQWMSIFSNELKEGIYSAQMKEKLKDIDSSLYLFDAFARAPADNFIEKAIYADIVTYLPGDLTVKMDIATMANSLEVRSPFLDHKLMEFAASIPINLKLKGFTTKYILKKAISRFLPAKILKRGKMGFGVPLAAWFRGELKNFVYDILLDKRSLKRGYFNSGAIKNLVNEHISGKSDYSHHIWALLNLELWHRMFIDGQQ